ncbi:MAG: phospholipase D family protein [Thiothrix sp.]|nr:MAG: phospholipase D family protein [Thiothrix sp.]
MGNKSLTIKPEPLAATTVNPQTPLYQLVANTLKAQSEPSTNLLYALGNPHLALLERLQLIDAATDTIDVQYYLFHDDDSGRALLQALVEAANRGVKVRLLLDDMDMLGRDGIFVRLIQDNPNFQVRIFNPFYLRILRLPEYLARFPQVTRRMHNKSLTVDRVVTIAGGRNIGNEYFSFKTEVAFADFDLLAAGKIGQDITAAFNTYWSSGIAFDLSTLNQAADDARFKPWQAEASEVLASYRQEALKEQSELNRFLKSIERQIYYADIKVIADHPEKVISSFSNTEGNITADIVELFSSAQHELVISSPYFIPGSLGLEVFQNLRKRGVEVIILTNSFAANDVAAVHAGYLNYRRRLLEMGVKLYELKPQNTEAELAKGFELFGSKRASLHAKAFVVDQKTTFVGSFNLDPRSSVHNTEMGLIFDEPAYAAASVEKTRLYMQQQAYEVKLNANNEIIWLDNVNGISHTVEPDTSVLQRGITRVISWLPVEWLM